MRWYYDQKKAIQSAWPDYSWAAVHFGALCLLEQQASDQCASCLVCDFALIACCVCTGSAPNAVPSASGTRRRLKNAHFWQIAR